MMEMMFKSMMPLAIMCVFGAVACGEPTEGEGPASGSEALQVDRADQVKGGLDGKSDSSVIATFVDMSFSGSLVTDSDWRPEAQIEDQLLYTVGHLNGSNSVGRLDKLVLSNVVSTPTMDGKYRVDYDATMLVAWGERGDVPAEYALTLPLDVSPGAKEVFTEKYADDCVDYGAHPNARNFWYYFRPNRSSCNFAEADVVRTTAKLAVSEVNTTGKYPEYHKVWEDDVLKIVAIFGKYEYNATSNSDAGIRAYNEFLETMKQRFAGNGLETYPAEVPRNPGVALDDVTFVTTLDSGRKLEVVAMLVGNVRETDFSFNDRYDDLSTDADFIAYNGHAGLGANIRALASKGNWTQGQYSIVFMNGCDTYAYVDNALFEARAEVNPDDPTGTKHLDIITNALPSYFSNMSASTLTFIDGLSDPQNPMTFEEMFRKISSSQVILVSGEEDNVFVPGYSDTDPVEPMSWDGMEDSGVVARDEETLFSTPVVEAGTYVFEMEGTSDADLYVRIGDVPSLDRYDCRPYKAGSRERCVVELNSPAPIILMVRGYASSSEFTLTGRRD